MSVSPFSTNMDKFGWASDLAKSDPMSGNARKAGLIRAKNLRRRHRNRKRFKTIGQRQKWFAFRYLGDGSDVNLTAHGPQEFSEWRWADLDTIANVIVPFKRPVYEQLMVEFKPFAKTVP